MMVNLSGKRALVTGASGGIGFEVAKGLLRVGASVLITGRDARKLALASEFLKKDTGKTAIETEVIDFKDLAAAAYLSERADKVDILVNNAGLITSERQLSANDHELQWQVNYLAPAYLTLSLAQKMPKDGRIVNVASGAHRRGQLDLNDLDFRNRAYKPLVAYGQSKLAMIMLTRHLAHIWKGNGPHVYAVHPGVVRTDFARDTGWLGTLFNLFKPFYLSPRLGARGVLSAACSPFTADMSGAYFENAMPVEPSKLAQDADNAAALYDYTIEALGSIEAACA